jgi:signal transduction histidine kinase
VPAPIDDAANAVPTTVARRKFGWPRAGHGPSEPQSVSRASARLRALAALSGSLTDALSPEAAADLVQQKALSALGATSAIVVTLGAFPPAAAPSVVSIESQASDTLHVVHAIGLPDEVRAALEELPLDAPVPFAEVAREGEPLFLASEAEMRRYPDWAVAMIGAGARAAAIVPVWANGELRGVLGLAWSAPHAFDEDERAFVLTLGVMCAQAIMRAHLKAAELEARRDAERARETAEKANASKAHFLATISHELRTPVNAVIGYSAMLTDEIYGPVSALQKDHLGRMNASGQHLLGLIEDLLGHARLDAGEEVVRPTTVRLLELMHETLDLVRPLADRKGLRIRVEAPTESIELHTDPRKLRQILVNLLGNAIKFTAAGDVMLHLRIEGIEPCIRVFFEVTDTGTGISPEDQAHIFDPYWQHDATSPLAGGSTGLGLAVARTLARLLGGDVTCARSALGKGSTFVVSLPARYAPAIAFSPLTFIAPALATTTQS